MGDDLMMSGLGCMMAVIAIGLAGLVVGVAADTFYERRAFPAITACETRRMTPDRRLLSSTVVCVPTNTRQDTTTVNVNAKSQ